MKIVVIGGGINGLSCAIQILENIEGVKDVTILSDAVTPNTTGDGSAGLWSPYLLGSTQKEKVHNWSKGMHDFLEKIWLSDKSGSAGVCLIPVTRLTTSENPVESFWRDIVYGYRKISKRELAEFNEGRRSTYKSGIHFISYTSEPIKLLPYLMKRFQSNGGKLITQNVVNFTNFVLKSSYDVIINCTGLGAKCMLPDNDMYPIRGQVSNVKASWIFKAVLDDTDDGIYIIPNTESVILGGTHQKNDYNLDVSKNDKNMIVDGCCSLIPGLKHVEPLFDWVGLRPGRPELRLQPEQFENNKVVIHNYGHGGSGVTIAWGCASEVIDILLEIYHDKIKRKSKL